MEENKTNQSGPSNQQTDELNCPSHNQKRWGIDKTIFSWHRWLPLHDRPNLRWALAVVLALVIIAIMITGIVFTAEYYTAYYASGAWIWDHAKANSTQGRVATAETMVPIGATQTSKPDISLAAMRNEKSNRHASLHYIPGILQTAPCDPRWGCAQFGQPVRNIFDDNLMPRH